LEQKNILSTKIKKYMKKYKTKNYDKIKQQRNKIKNEAKYYKFAFWILLLAVIINQLLITIL
jgi:hypothetical protein